METIKVYAAIIGGGASGLMCACVASKKNSDKRIVVIERDNRVGKKIMVSGNSRCNLTNLDANKKHYHTTFELGVDYLLEHFTPSDVLSKFESIGLSTYADSENRVYPLSRQSSAVLSVLRNELKRQNVEEICDTEVLSISKCDYGYKLSCKDKTVFAKKVVIATGGKNNYAQKVVSDTYTVSKSIGHNLTELSPSLSPVKVDSKVIKSLKGIRAQGSVTAVVNGKKIKTESGEIQFGVDCLSGICVFNLSRILNKEKNGEIIVNLLSDYSLEEIIAILRKRVELTKNENVQEIFTGLFHKNIGIALLKESKIDTNINSDKLTKAELTRLANTINEWHFKTVPSGDFTSAQVTAGGVKGSEIDPKTFESKMAKNVYLCGEAIDVDGDCGGFNLHFAFASGMLVGEQL
ncbi:MAG: aminoacetone oxidase family FAD-binding enzyme [Ruminococcus sp.]|nr:aminoacetone oxidase family FAD-binding enzyme [Ruminococcus sp.]